MTAAVKLKILASWKKSYDKPRWHIKKQRHHFGDTGPSSQSYAFSCSHEWIWELDHKEGQAPKNWCFQRVSWKRLFRLYWTLRRSNLSVLKVNNPEYSLEGLRWSWSSNTLATQCREQTRWKRPWFWRILRAGGKGDNRGWDAWMASLTQWTWVWANSRKWWRTG